MPLAHINLADIHISRKLDELPASLRHYLQVVPPDWLKQDILYKQILAMPMLLRHGRVVWAALVQANSLMFQPREENCPGEIVYDPTGTTEPGILLEMAQQLYQLKGTTPTQPDQLEYAHNLTGEMGRLFAHPFPQSLAATPLCISSIWFWRPHLPNGMLSLAYFPILLCDDEAFAGQVMPLPALFWPAALQQQWLQHDIAHQDYTQSNTLERLPKLAHAQPPLSYLFKGAYSSAGQIRAFLNPAPAPKRHMLLDKRGLIVIAVALILLAGLFFMPDDTPPAPTCSELMKGQPADVLNMVCQNPK